AKMNVGIADTLITNIFSQMIKGSGKILLVPCDLVCGDIETEIPNGNKIIIRVDQFNCQNALNLRKFPNVSLFEHPKEILAKLKEFENDEA
ncbi:MAG: flavoprotein, partial [Promethearchaeota archaeon]